MTYHLLTVGVDSLLPSSTILFCYYILKDNVGFKCKGGFFTAFFTFDHPFYLLLLQIYFIVDFYFLDYCIEKTVRNCENRRKIKVLQCHDGLTTGMMVVHCQHDGRHDLWKSSPSQGKREVRLHAKIQYTLDTRKRTIISKCFSKIILHSNTLDTRKQANIFHAKIRYRSPSSQPLK